MHTLAFIAVYSSEQVWPMGLLFLKTSPVKQYSYENDFSGVFDALHQSFLVSYLKMCKKSYPKGLPEQAIKLIEKQNLTVYKPTCCRKIPFFFNIAMWRQPRLYAQGCCERRCS